MQPPRGTREQLEAACKAAAEHFLESRTTEPLEAYIDLVDDARARLDRFLRATDDLLRLEAEAPAQLESKDDREVFRYLAAPPVSEDDLKVLVRARSLAPGRLREDPELVRKLVAFFRL